MNVDGGGFAVWRTDCDQMAPETSPRRLSVGETQFNAHVKVCTRDYEPLFTSFQPGSAPAGVLYKLL